MTNRELLRTTPERLGALDKQRRHVLAVESTPAPCPVCRAPVDAITASGLDVDQYSFDAKTPNYCCPHGQAVLDRVTPLIALGPGWLWQINHDWLTERLEKARRGRLRFVLSFADSVFSLAACVLSRDRGITSGEGRDTRHFLRHIRPGRRG